MPPYSSYYILLALLWEGEEKVGKIIRNALFLGLYRNSPSYKRIFYRLMIVIEKLQLILEIAVKTFG